MKRKSLITIVSIFLLSILYSFHFLRQSNSARETNKNISEINTEKTSETTDNFGKRSDTYTVSINSRNRIQEKTDKALIISSQNTNSTTNDKFKNIFSKEFSTTIALGDNKVEYLTWDANENREIKLSNKDIINSYAYLFSRYQEGKFSYHRFSEKFLSSLNCSIGLAKAPNSTLGKIIMLQFEKKERNLIIKIEIEGGPKFIHQSEKEYFFKKREENFGHATIFGDGFLLEMNLLHNRMSKSPIFNYLYLSNNRELFIFFPDTLKPCK